MTDLSRAIELLYDLHVGTTSVEEGSPHERPHKPLMLLSVLDLIDEDLATPQRIPWCQELRDRFSERFKVVKKHNDRNTPENPFFYLSGDGLWTPWKDGAQGQEVLGSTPKVGDFGTVFARLEKGFERLISTPENRQALREALVTRYFPDHANELLGERPYKVDDSHQILAEEPLNFGRDPAFRRKIIEIYDHQCAACGLRIRLPQGNDVSFIDAAHLLPYAESRNDHPTNGLALCKNHHWAMDRHLIAPGPDLTWHVSKILEARRSNGEKELLDLANNPVLSPRDSAYNPKQDALEWRLDRLIA